MAEESFSHVWLSETPWAVARRAPLYMGFSRQTAPNSLIHSETWTVCAMEISISAWQSHTMMSAC